MDRLETATNKKAAKLESQFKDVASKAKAGKISNARAEKKLTDIQYKYMNNEFQANVKMGTLALEHSSLQKYSYKDMKKENRDVAITDAITIGASATSVAVASMAGMPFAMVVVPSHRGTRQSSRLAKVDDKVKKDMVATARDRAISSGNNMVRRNADTTTIVIKPEDERRR